MDDGFNCAAMLLEQIHDRGRVANVHVLMFVIAKVRDQVIARFFRGSFGAKKLCAQVVVDPKDMRAAFRETPHALRANQSRRTCNDDGTHHGDFISSMTGEGASAPLIVVTPQSSMSRCPRKDSLARREIAGRPQARARLAGDFS